MRSRPAKQTGIGLIEMFLGATFLAVAVLGTVSGMMSSLRHAMDNEEARIARAEAQAVVDCFRDAATEDFDQALANYMDMGQAVESRNRDREVRTRIHLDETRYDPPIDLNGDGDFEDTHLIPEQVTAAYLETEVRWGRKRLTLVSLVRRPAPKVGATPRPAQLQLVATTPR